MKTFCYDRLGKARKILQEMLTVVVVGVVVVVVVVVVVEEDENESKNIDTYEEL